MNRTVFTKLVRNGVVIRAVLLALATIVLIAAGQRTLVPFAVSIYAIWNAAAVTRLAAKAAAKQS